MPPEAASNHQPPSPATSNNSNSKIPQTGGSAIKGLKQTSRRAEREGAVVLEHQPARPLSCVLRGQKRSELVGRPGSTRPIISHQPVGRRPSPRARVPRARHSLDDGQNPFMPRATLATMRGSGPWPSRPLRRSQSLAPVRLARLGRRHLSSHVPCRDARFLSFAARHFALRTAVLGSRRSSTQWQHHLSHHVLVKHEV